jgi:AhpD family alkylhydroperoxidase
MDTAISEHAKASQSGSHVQRLNYAAQSPELFKKLADFSTAIRNGSIEGSIIHLVDIRASQLNGCSFCLDMHVKEAKIHGERELRLYHVATWRESPLFEPRERAALAWTEALTRLPEGGVPDELYESVRSRFSEKELADLTFAVMAINAWNRAGVAFRSAPGSADKLYGLDKAGLN